MTARSTLVQTERQEWRDAQTARQEAAAEVQRLRALIQSTPAGGGEKNRLKQELAAAQTVLNEANAAVRTERSEFTEIRDTFNDFYRDAQLLYPWMTRQLAAVYADNWIIEDDGDLALAATRESEVYEAMFPGIKRDNGTLRMSETEYFATVEAMEDALVDAELNPSFFGDLIVQAIQGNVSTNEFRARVSAMEERVNQAGEEYVETYAAYFGGADPDTTKAAMVAMALDPTIGAAVLERRIAIAEIGGTAAAQGFSLNRRMANKLRQAGLQKAGSQELFRQAGELLPGLGGVARRSNEGNFGLTDFVGAEALGDVEQRNRLRRSIAGEQSRFTEQGGITETDQLGRQSGLRRR